jgi:hypothetical protein
MMLLRLSPSSLKEGRWYEYLSRFILGGAATVFAGLMSSVFGASIGGLFLAMPVIFCASATLIERHEIRRKREAGLSGARRGREAAALEAAGAAVGSIGMLAFALFFWLTIEVCTHLAFLGAAIAWTFVSVVAWWLYKRSPWRRRHS